MGGLSYKILFLIFLTSTLGVLIGFFVSSFLERNNNLRKSVEIRGGGGGEYNFINPLLECEIAEGAINSKKVNFQNELSVFISKEKASNNIDTLSVYLRDLNNGPVISVGGENQYSPASLLKVPVAISYYKTFESDPSILSKKILFEKEYPNPFGGYQYIKPLKNILVGEKYTIQELVERSLIYSDNQAVQLLYENVQPLVLRELYSLLGVDQGVLDGPEGTLSTRQYSAFFRILFNSSFLNNKNSNEILEMLSKTEFNNGIVAGVPKGTLVSHKFGESGFLNGIRQLHDCGVVYYPKRPYLICIMSRGGEVDSLKNSIRNVSEFVYKKMSSVN